MSVETAEATATQVSLRSRTKGSVQRRSSSTAGLSDDVEVMASILGRDRDRSGHSETSSSRDTWIRLLLSSLEEVPHPRILA